MKRGLEISEIVFFRYRLHTTTSLVFLNKNHIFYFIFFIFRAIFQRQLLTCFDIYILSY